jgi:DNA-binding transcriptional regulator YiaG
MNSIKALRKKCGMSQREFAKYFQVPLGTVRNWDQGLCKCPAYVVKLMVEKLTREELL